MDNKDRMQIKISEDWYQKAVPTDGNKYEVKEDEVEYFYSVDIHKDYFGLSYEEMLDALEYDLMKLFNDVMTYKSDEDKEKKRTR